VAPDGASAQHDESVRWWLMVRRLRSTLCAAPFGPSLSRPKRLAAARACVDRSLVMTLPRSAAAVLDEDTRCGDAWSLTRLGRRTERSGWSGPGARVRLGVTVGGGGWVQQVDRGVGDDGAGTLRWRRSNVTVATRPVVGGVVGLARRLRS
jgi:hypothetical protein